MPVATLVSPLICSVKANDSLFIVIVYFNYFILNRNLYIMNVHIMIAQPVLFFF